jgi:hypothetical protein
VIEINPLGIGAWFWVYGMEVDGCAFRESEGLVGLDYA